MSDTMLLVLGIPCVMYSTVKFLGWCFAQEAERHAKTDAKIRKRLEQLNQRNMYKGCS